MLRQEIEKLTTTWKPILLEIFQEFNILEEKYEEERIKYDGFLEIFPPQNLVFNAFNRFNFQDLKVVILGQDPYHQPKQANGLCFSVDDGIKIPPSLKNIFKEINSDTGVFRNNGDLSYLSKQGVLLLNTSLTVRENHPGSHTGLDWNIFTDKIINEISIRKKNIVFLLWGNKSKLKEQLIDPSKHLILKSGHPSPLSANRGLWFGNKHFSKTNLYLSKKNIQEINW